MIKEEYFIDETKSVYKTVRHEDGTMEPFVFNGKEWVNVPIGHLAQAQWNGHKIDEAEAIKRIDEQKRI